MKRLLPILFSVSTLCSGQALTLDNTWLAGSTVIFIAVENKLILRGKVESITSLHSDKAKIEKIGDTLIVKPVQPGNLVIVLKTADQSVLHEYTAAYLPMFSLVITGDSVDTKNVRKEKIAKTKSIYLISRKSDIKLYEDYLITESVLNINDKSYQSPGDRLSGEVKQAIGGLNTGSIIKVEQVTAKSKSTGKEMKLKSNQSFTIL